jgi:protein-S-isoprenylcysteine O-methyltransferase Ste14
MSASRSEEAPANGADTPETMLPPRHQRPPLESAFVRIVATGGVVGLGVAIGAILTSQHVAGWIVGLVVALVSVIVSAVLWSSRQV